MACCKHSLLVCWPLTDDRSSSQSGPVSHLSSHAVCILVGLDAVVLQVYACLLRMLNQLSGTQVQLASLALQSACDRVTVRPRHRPLVRPGLSCCLSSVLAASGADVCLSRKISVSKCCAAIHAIHGMHQLRPGPGAAMLAVHADKCDS